MAKTREQKKAEKAALKAQKILATQLEYNKQLALALREMGINKLRLISMGNSIASGYSIARTTQPLLLRNATLKEILKKAGIDVRIHHFARAQNNNDKRVHDWLENNIKESEIHKMNRSDYADREERNTSMGANGLTDELMDKYYPTEMDRDPGLRDLAFDSRPDLANVIVYNGATGSFLDGVTRKGKLSQKLTYGVNRDITGITETLDDILNNNRMNNTDTQVYLCGAPNLLGIHVSGIINRKLKKLAKKYPNVTYVDPVRAKMFNKKLTKAGAETPFTAVDIHYNEDEYRKFNNNITKAIWYNYEINRILIRLDRKMYRLSTSIELNRPEYHTAQYSSDKKDMIYGIINRELSDVTSPFIKAQALKAFKKYMKEVYAYDYYYTGKDELNVALTISEQAANEEYKQSRR